jgi:hypothetical protein
MFANLKGASDLCRKLVETKKHSSSLVVFLFVKLALIMSVATSTIERAFSTIKITKTDLRNITGDDSCIIVSLGIEIDVIQSINTDAIMHIYHGKRDRIGGVTMNMLQ